MFELLLLQGKNITVGGLLRLPAHFPDSWSCPEVQLIWAALMCIWQSIEDVLSPLVSLLCEICHFNDHLSSQVWFEYKFGHTFTPSREILEECKSSLRLINWNLQCGGHCFMPWSGSGWVTAHVGGETQCGPACPCLIMSNQNTKHCEGERCDHIPMRKLYSRVKKRIALIDKHNKNRGICLGDIFISVKKWEIAKFQSTYGHTV